jgi:hypothetical protein
MTYSEMCEKIEREKFEMYARKMLALASDFEKEFICKPDCADGKTTPQYVVDKP